MLRVWQIEQHARTREADPIHLGGTSEAGDEDADPESGSASSEATVRRASEPERRVVF